MTEFNMRIANRAPKTSNNCYPFSIDCINNIPDIDIFTEEHINEKIKLGCQDVLRRSMHSSNAYRYGEMGLLISTLDDTIYERFVGKYESVPVKGTSYGSIVTNRQTKDLFFIHNHPNNSLLSFSDVSNLINAKSIYGVIAVGNRHNLHIVTKEDDSLALTFGRYVAVESTKLCNADTNKKPMKFYEDTVCANVLSNNPGAFGLSYMNLRRKQI